MFFLHFIFLIFYFVFLPTKIVHQIYFLSIWFWNWSKFAELLCMLNFFSQKIKLVIKELQNHPICGSIKTAQAIFAANFKIWELYSLLCYHFFSEKSLFFLCFVNSRNCYKKKHHQHRHLASINLKQTLFWIHQTVWHKHFALYSFSLVCSWMLKYCWPENIYQSKVLLPI